MFRFAFHIAAAIALVTVALAGAASAEVTYYIEDFENNGEPGFDPVFNHEFSGGPEGIPNWAIQEGPPGAFYLILVSGTTDAITFNLPSHTTVVYARSIGSPISPATSTSVRFIGSGGTWETGPADYGQTLVEITSDQIGAIRQIELHSAQGGFTSVTIGVIPEPTGMVLLLVLVIVGAAMRASVWKKGV